MFVLYMLLWILFNGRFTLEIFLIGLPVCALVYGFTLKYLDLTFRQDLARTKKLPRILGYLFFLLREVIRSALHVMKLIWSPGGVHPELRRFETDLQTGTANVVLADSITLTPGTITVFAEGNKLTVHCLDTSTGEGIEDSAMLQKVRQLEEKHAGSL